NYAEGQEHDQVALRKWLSVGKVFRKSEGSGQCNDSAHARPSENKDLPQRRSWVTLPKQPSADEVRKVGAGKQPKQAQHDHDAAEQSAILQQLAEAVFVNAREHIRQLQADHHEGQTVDDEG